MPRGFGWLGRLWRELTGDWFPDIGFDPDELCRQAEAELFEMRKHRHLSALRKKQWKLDYDPGSDRLRWSREYRP